MSAEAIFGSRAQRSWSRPSQSQPSFLTSAEQGLSRQSKNFMGPPFKPPDGTPYKGVRAVSRRVHAHPPGDCQLFPGGASIVSSSFMAWSHVPASRSVRPS